MLHDWIAKLSGISVACLGEVGGNEGHADPEIRFIEVIRNIPAELAILAPFLNNSVEEGQDPHQWPESLHNDAHQVISKGKAVNHLYHA